MVILMYIKQASLVEQWSSGIILCVITRYLYVLLWQVVVPAHGDTLIYVDELDDL